ncbi:site-specific integrase [Duganella qianjiadongensis]|uniref:Site-specific integrase n=1 Tax=Duganella qianjiadongensis TaxID=2692176 RepID=A0ABW9VLL5_9BURK|nr:site-specific integrase [Duganella qianjiadongensis]MYM39795.1 site-specific integrase [Duganella qianjiadongensis]
MTDTLLTEPAEVLDLNLDRTARPGSRPGTPFWEGDLLKVVGIMNIDCSGFKVLEPETRHSLREHLLLFAESKKYATTSYIGAVRSLNNSLTQYPTREFDLAWLVKAITLSGVKTTKGTLKSFFIYWKDRYPLAISSDALQLLVRSLPRTKRPRNVLSDDPEKSWLTDLEYDALLQCIWDNYDHGITTTQVTLMRLLSLQYARRPVQLTSLKIGDFRDGPAEGGGTGGRRISFPGAKDKGALQNFRDSKEEVHPVAVHLWDLFQIQKHAVKALFKEKLDIALTEQELAQLPVFIHAAQLENAVEALTSHYGFDWRTHLDNWLFHIGNKNVSSILAWRSNTLGDNSDKSKKQSPPLSHRTGRPIKVSSTRIRHTRARQLARLGTPKDVLSFWLGHTYEKTIDSYYNDPAEEARYLDETMKGALVPLAMAFTGKLLDDASQASRANDPESTLEFATGGNLKDVGKCGKHSFCATTSVPIPCYRCKLFEPLVYAPHDEVLNALQKRQAAEDAMIKIGGTRKLLTPIDLGPDIRAVQSCIAKCNVRKAELEANRG